MIIGHSQHCTRAGQGANVGGRFCSFCGNELKYQPDPAPNALTGERLYNAFRSAWNPKAVKRGHQAGLPRWKNLKPWVTKVWNTAADTLNKEDTL